MQFEVDVVPSVLLSRFKHGIRRLSPSSLPPLAEFTDSERGDWRFVALVGERVRDLQKFQRRLSAFKRSRHAPCYDGG